MGEIATKYRFTGGSIQKCNRLKSNTVFCGKSLKIVTAEIVVHTIKKEQRTNGLFLNNSSDKLQISTLEGKISTEDNTKKFGSSIDDLKKC